MKQSSRSKLKDYARRMRCAGWLIVLMAIPLASGVRGQETPSGRPLGAAICGSVVDPQGHPVADATVSLNAKGIETEVRVRTDSEGKFSFPPVADAEYQLVAEKAGRKSAEAVRSGVGSITLVIAFDQARRGAASKMEFSDQPHFSVAGLTDWTAAGGHGSDTILRTSESLADATVALETRTFEKNAGGADDKLKEMRLVAALQHSPNDFAANEELGELYVRQTRFQMALLPLRTASQLKPESRENTYALAQAYQGVGDFSQARQVIQPELAKGNDANAYRIAGELDEKRGDPISALREFEKAATLDPSEQNEFEWASELLVHRAISQAEEVFREGANSYPASMRMRAGFGAALFAGSHYQDAASQMCKASDLDLGAVRPYISLGEIEVASPHQLDCVQPALARFLKLHPESATANYFYAMALLKDRPVDSDARAIATTSLEKATSLDPTFGEAYLQLGVLAIAQSDVQAAIRLYLQAIRAKPELTEAHFRLGVAYDRIGDRAKASQEFATHQEMKEKQAASVEDQRREVRQFLFTAPDGLEAAPGTGVATPPPPSRF